MGLGGPQIEQVGSQLGLIVIVIVAGSPSDRDGWATGKEREEIVK